MCLSNLSRKVPILLLLVCSIAAYAQRPRWSSRSYGLTESPEKGVVADVNGDGIKDLVIALPGPDTTELAVLLGNANGTFQSPKYSPYDGAFGIAVADFTGDRKLDLATSFGGLFSGSGDGYFHYQSAIPGAGAAVDVLTDDFNKDGKPDLAVFEYFGTNSPLFQRTLLGDGHGGFTATGEYASQALDNPPGPFFSAEFNGDGKPDLLIRFRNKVGTSTPTSVFVQLGKGDGSFTPLPLLNDTLTPAGIGLGDVNGDKKLDMVLAGAVPLSGGGIGSSQIHTYIDKGDASSASFVSAAIDCFHGLAVGDLNGDGRSDLLCSSVAGSPITFYSSNGNGSYTKGTVFPAIGLWTAANGIIIADLNRDGTRDAILLNADRTVTALLNLSGTWMSESTSPSTLIYKQPFSLNASVAASLPQTQHPTGSVTYRDGAATLGSAGLGSAFKDAAGLTVGTHLLSASYGGDGNFNPHTVTVSRTVAKAASTTKLASTLNPSSRGQAVTFTAIMVPQFAGTPTGKVSFKDGSTVLATVSMSSGKATYTTSSLAAGTHSITAVYTGDGNFKASTSAVLFQKVN
jgi:Big-like domain-containing protein/VCBS repeat protein